MTIMVSCIYTDYTDTNIIVYNLVSYIYMLARYIVLTRAVLVAIVYS